MKAALSLVGLLGCAQPQDGAESETSISGEKADHETISPYQAVRVREASPDENFSGQKGYIGCSADGFDRYLVRFPEVEKDVSSAVIVLDAQSGTCASSYDNTKCDLEMTVEAQPVLSLWTADSVTWSKISPLHSEAGLPVGATTFSVPYQGAATIQIDVTEYVQRVAGKGIEYGFILQAANDTETTRREQRMLHENDDVVCGRGIQRDVVVGNPRLEVTYK
jgi:hypothetical protein